MALRIGLLVVLCALRAVAQPLITATFEWDVDAGSPDASAIVERDGVTAPCLTYAKPSATVRRCSAQIPSGQASFRVRMVDASGVPGPWSDAVVATIGSGSPPGSFVISWNSSISPGAGPVAFPTTGVIDNFNRADGSLGANWAADPMGLSVSGHSIVSNGATSGEHSYWSAGTFGPNVEAWMTIRTIAAGQFFGFYTRIQSVGGAGTADGYEVVWVEDGTLEVSRTINSFGAGTALLLSTTIASPANGYKIGVRVTGTGSTVTIDIYVDTGSGWGASPVATVTDTDALRILAAGHIGFLSHSSVVVEEFGGGNAVISSGPRALGGPASGHRRRRLAA